MAHVLRNALLPDGRNVDVTLEVAAGAGSISAIGPVGQHIAAGNTSDDLEGRLLLPAFGDAHAHIDKALTGDAIPNPKGDLMGAIEAWIDASSRGVLNHEDMVERTTSALERLLLNGTTAVRSHINIGGASGTDYLRAVREAMKRFEGLMDIQLVALTHQPMTGRDGAGNRAALDQAIEMGIDLVGGCPHLDPDPQGLIDHAISVALAAGIGIDLHTDETLDPHMLTLPLIARAIQETGFPHPVTASHCVSLSVQPLKVQQSVAREVAAAGISIVPLPQTNLFLQGWEHPVSMPRGITPIDVLRDHGVLVAAGADNVQDPFNPMGRSDALETAALLVMAAHQLPDTAMDLVSNSVRQVIGLERVGMHVGSPADLVALPASSVRNAMADAPRDRMVYRHGRLVARRTESSMISRP